MLALSVLTVGQPSAPAVPVPPLALSDHLPAQLEPREVQPSQSMPSVQVTPSAFSQPEWSSESTRLKSVAPKLHSDNLVAVTPSIGVNTYQLTLHKKRLMGHSHPTSTFEKSLLATENLYIETRMTESIL